MASSTTQAGDWWQARKRGERLPEHNLFCDLCSEQKPESDFDRDAAKRTGFMVCTACLERHAEASL